MAHSTPKDDHYSYTSTRCPPITWETGIKETKSAQSTNNFNCSVLIPHVQLSHALARLLVLLKFTQSNKNNSFLWGMVSMHLHQTKRSGEEAGVRLKISKQQTMSRKERTQIQIGWFENSAERNQKCLSSFPGSVVPFTRYSPVLKSSTFRQLSSRHGKPRTKKQ